MSNQTKDYRTMKANLELRSVVTEEYIRRLGKVHFILEQFAEPGSQVTKLWRVNGLVSFKRRKDALRFMSSEADLLGGGDCIGDENYKAAWQNHIYSFALEDEAE